MQVKPLASHLYKAYRQFITEYSITGQDHWKYRPINYFNWLLLNNGLISILNLH